MARAVIIGGTGVIRRAAAWQLPAAGWDVGVDQPVAAASIAALLELATYRRRMRW